MAVSRVKRHVYVCDGCQASGHGHGILRDGCAREYGTWQVSRNDHDNGEYRHDCVSACASFLHEYAGANAVLRSSAKDPRS